MRLDYVFILSALILSGCSYEKSSTSINAMVIHYTGSGCKFAVSEQPISTLDSVMEMRGSVGRVVRSELEITSNPDILDNYLGFKPVDLQFSKSGNTYGAMDLDTLFATSLYYSIEQGYLLFQKYGMDFSKMSSPMSETRIVHRAKSLSGSSASQQSEIHDNAEFLAHHVQQSGQDIVRNYFFSYPSEELKDVPLGLNVGVMVHEFSHLVFHWQFFENAYRNLKFVNTTKPTENTLAALDEGMADYFGFLATSDPSFFLCSYPNENRALATSKSFTPTVVQNLNSSYSNFDSHEAGAVWASIQYEIGNKIGHEANAKSLVQLMSYISQCTDTASGTNITADFGDIAKCHASLLNTRTDINNQSGDVRAIYQKYLGSYGGRF